MDSGVGSPPIGPTTPTHTTEVMSLGVGSLLSMSLKRIAHEVFLRWNWWWFNWREGLKEDFPFCCILRFSVENAISPLRPQALMRGGDWRGLPYVACAIFHEGKENIERLQNHVKCQDRRMW